MNFYNYDEIKDTGNCLDYAITVLGMKPVNGSDMFNIPWRTGSDSGALQISKEKWFDYVTKEGGSILDLVCRFREVTILDAQNELGEYFNLEAKGAPKKDFHPGSRYEKLKSDGYVVTAEYPYTDIAGTEIYKVMRLEHSTDSSKKKEFLQRTSKGWGISGVEMTLYNLPYWFHCPWVCIVEGEKDVETLKALGIPATTNSGGAEKWLDEFSELLEGKKVFILPDNDQPGQNHAKLIASKIKNKVIDIFVITVSQLEKGDVTDYFLKEGGTIESFNELLSGASKLKESDLDEDDYNPIVQDAKQANKVDLCNYVLAPGTGKNGNKTMDKEPRQINDIVKDIKTRLCHFPKKVGEQLFDHDREDGSIKYIHQASSMFAWIQQKTGRKTKWSPGVGFVPKTEVYEAVLASAERYEGISFVPDWPKRKTVYYAHKDLPDASQGHKYFNEFVGFFNPADEAQESFLRSFIAAPLYYLKGIPKPSWIIDSANGAGVGKTTLVEVISSLYEGPDSSGGGLMRTSPQQLRQNFDDLVRRLVSSEGRLSRMVLIDNVTGSFNCPQLADLITSSSVSGKAPYGRGEESRPNNLVYVITANSASVDNDLTIRSYYIKLRKPMKSSSWKTDVMNYIHKNRLHIIADIIDILNKGAEFLGSETPYTRFPEFEHRVLAPMCGNMKKFSAAIEALESMKDETNTEKDEALHVRDIFNAKLRKLNIKADENVFIQTPIVQEWGVEAFPHVKNPNTIVQAIRNMAKNGYLDSVNDRITIYPHNGNNRRRGIMWGNPKRGEHVKIIAVNADGKAYILAN